MKERFYYIRDKENRPIVTVCVLSKDGKMSRGVSICSKDDQVSKKAGQRLAKNRALKAAGRKKSSDRIRYPQKRPFVSNGVTPEDQLLRVTAGFRYKAIYNPMLTGFEQHLLGIGG